MSRTGEDAVDFRVMELIVSRLCHDLVSPVGAVNNGVELIDEMGEEVLDDAMGLIGQSARIAAARLAMFRLAYGFAGSSPQVNWRDLRQAAESWLSNGKSVVEWPQDSVPSDDAPRRYLRYAGKVVLNLIILLEECMPNGGTIAVEMNDYGMCVSGAARTARLNDAGWAALRHITPVEELNTRSIHAYLVGWYAQIAGMDIDATNEEATLADGSVGERLTLTLRKK